MTDDGQAQRPLGLGEGKKGCAAVELGAIQPTENSSTENSCSLNPAWKCVFSTEPLTERQKATALFNWRTDCALETVCLWAQCTRGLSEMQSEECVCACVCECASMCVCECSAFGYRLLSYSDTWRTVIGQEHPSGHLVCGPRGVYPHECVCVCLCVSVIIIKPSFSSSPVCLCICVCVGEEMHLQFKMSCIKKSSSQPLDVLNLNVCVCV